MKNINAGLPFPGRREDFPSEAAWNHWRTTETSTLSQIMKAMMSLNPDLVKSMPGEGSPLRARPGSVYSNRDAGIGTSRHASSGSRRSMVGGLEGGEDGDHGVVPMLLYTGRGLSWAQLFGCADRPLSGCNVNSSLGGPPSQSHANLLRPASTPPAKYSLVSSSFSRCSRRGRLSCVRFGCRTIGGRSPGPGLVRARKEARSRRG